MTNEEAIYQLNVMACGKKKFEEFDIKALSIAINSIQENTKLKIEIEQLKRLINEQSELNIEQFKQIDKQYQEIEQLQSTNAKLCEENAELRKEVIKKQLF